MYSFALFYLQEFYLQVFCSQLTFQQPPPCLQTTSQCSQLTFQQPPPCLQTTSQFTFPLPQPTTSQFTFPLPQPPSCQYFQYSRLVVDFLEVPSHLFCLCHLSKQILAWNYGNARAQDPGTYHPGVCLFSSAPKHFQQQRAYSACIVLP